MDNTESRVEFLSMSPEILAQTLSYLPIHDLIRISRVNQYLNQLITKQSTCWQRVQSLSLGSNRSNHKERPCQSWLYVNRRKINEISKMSKQDFMETVIFLWTRCRRCRTLSFESIGEQLIDRLDRLFLYTVMPAASTHRWLQRVNLSICVSERNLPNWTACLVELDNQERRIDIGLDMTPVNGVLDQPRSDQMHTLLHVCATFRFLSLHELQFRHFDGVHPDSQREPFSSYVFGAEQHNHLLLRQLLAKHENLNLLNLCWQWRNEEDVREYLSMLNGAAGRPEALSVWLTHGSRTMLLPYTPLERLSDELMHNVKQLMLYGHISLAQISPNFDWSIYIRDIFRRSPNLRNLFLYYFYPLEITPEQFTRLIVFLVSRKTGAKVIKLRSFFHITGTALELRTSLRRGLRAAQLLPIPGSLDLPLDNRECLDFEWDYLKIRVDRLTFVGQQSMTLVMAGWALVYVAVLAAEKWMCRLWL